MELLKTSHRDNAPIYRLRIYRLRKTIKYDQLGFTVVEILVALGILLLIMSLGIFLSMDFYRSYAFRSEQKILVSVLHKARTRALSNINEYEHGVRIATSSYTIFQGPRPSPGPGHLTFGTRVGSLDETIPASPVIARSGLSEIVFEQLTGDSVTGNIVLSGQGRTASISINNEGGIDW